MILWAIKFRSQTKLDGKREHLVGSHTGHPILFKTRGEARNYIRLHYGYIADRPDLRREPHGWKMPIAVRVKVEVKEI